MKFTTIDLLVSVRFDRTPTPRLARKLFADRIYGTYFLTWHPTDPGRMKVVSVRVAAKKRVRR